MLWFETKLSFASSCRSTWPHCNTVYCRWGRHDTTDITNINAIAASKVSQGSHTLRKLREMAFPWKIGEIAGNLPSSSGNFWKQQNLKEFSGNGNGKFKCWFWECYVVFHMFCPQFPGKTFWKNKPFINSPRVDICNIYIYTHGELVNGLHTTK